MPIPDQVLRRLRGRGWLRKSSYALAEALFASNQGPPPAERLDWTADEIEDYLTHAGPRAQVVYHLCMVAITGAGPLLVRRARPFDRLDLAERAEALERLERGPLGLAVFGAKAVQSLVYYEHPDAAREIGFDGQCLVELGRTKGDEARPAVAPSAPGPDAQGQRARQDEPARHGRSGPVQARGDER